MFSSGSGQVRPKKSRLRRVPGCFRLGSFLRCGKPGSLVTEIIAYGEACIDRGLGKRCGDRKLGEGMVVEKEGVQVLGQGVIGREFDREQILPGGDLVVFDIQIPDYGDVVPQAEIRL